MIIQIFTYSEKIENGFMLYHKHYADYVPLETTKHAVYDVDQLTADTFNVGFAIKTIVNEDSKFGIVRKEKFANTHNTDKTAVEVKSWIEYKSGLKRFACVYTENEEVFKNVRYSIRVNDAYLTRVFNRIIQLKTDWGIGLECMKYSEMNDDVIKVMKQRFKD